MIPNLVARHEHRISRARLRLWECGGKRRRSGCRVVRHDRERKRNQDFLGRARCGNLLWNRAGNLPERSMSTILSNRINRSLSEVEMIGLRLRSANFIISKKWVDKVVGQNSSFATGGAKGKNHFWASSTSSQPVQIKLVLDEGDYDPYGFVRGFKKILVVRESWKIWNVMLPGIFVGLP